MQPGLYDIETEMCTPELDDVREYIPPEIQNNILEKRPVRFQIIFIFQANLINIILSNLSFFFKWRIVSPSLKYRSYVIVAQQKKRVHSANILSAHLSTHFNFGSTIPEIWSVGIKTQFRPRFQQLLFFSITRISLLIGAPISELLILVKNIRSANQADLFSVDIVLMYKI